MDAKTQEFIEGMRQAGRLAAITLKKAGELVRPGLTTNEIDKFVYDFTLEHGAKPATLNYKGFPKSVCTSVNHCICHGVPDDRPLKEGDIINIDVTSVLNGYYGDTSATFFVGEVSEKARALTECAYFAMHKGIEQVGAGRTTGDIGFATQKYCVRKGYYPVEEIGGHGIGTTFHDEPFVPAHGKKGKGYRLKPWKCITVEPMVNETPAGMLSFDIPGSQHQYYETEDKCLSAQFEHTLLVTDEGYEIMTLSPDGEEAVSFKASLG